MSIRQGSTLVAGSIIVQGTQIIGQIIQVACSSSFVPSGCLPCDGTEYSKAQFNDLWQNWLVGGGLLTCSYADYASDISTYGQCPKFAIDVNNNTFKTPIIKNGAYITQALSDNELGKSYNESLPNITGTLKDTDMYDTPIRTGCFYGYGSGASAEGGGSSSNREYTAFDASLSSSTYQDNAKVQGDNIRYRYFVVVANGTINQSQMDWASWASGLSSKLNKDHSNDENVYLKETYNNGYNGYRVWSDNYCEQWGQISIEQNQSAVVTLLKEYADTNYNVLTTCFREGTPTNADEVYGNVTTTSFKIYKFNLVGNVSWQTKGYIPQQ